MSSFVLHGVGLLLPNGLQGVYELKPYHETSLELGAEDITPPSGVLERLGEDGLSRIYWLRLEVLGDRLAYIVKPGPFDLERVYDARTLQRLDPLSEETLRLIADDQLIGTRVVELDGGDEFNRYYTEDEVPAIEFSMGNDQPSALVLSRLSGRTLRRTDPGAALFTKAYRSLHVWQWGNSVFFFSAILYGAAGVALMLVIAGFAMWWTRRDARRRWTPMVRPARRVHGRLAPFAGVFLATQMLVGAYLWFNLGLIEPRFRGQGSFRSEWSGGMSVSTPLADPQTILASIPPGRIDAEHPLQRLEWRTIGQEPFWIAYPTRDTNGVLINANSGEVWDRIPESLAAIAGTSVVLGEPAGPGVESMEYWMDYNLRIPTYQFRFTDPDDSDVHVSQITGEVIQRRPAIWRRFGPFLTYHTFGFTGNPWLDTLLLTALQGSILTMAVSGWRLAYKRQRTAEMDPDALKNS